MPLLQERRQFVLQDPCHTIRGYVFLGHFYEDLDHLLELESMGLLTYDELCENESWSDLEDVAIRSLES